VAKKKNVMSFTDQKQFSCVTSLNYSFYLEDKSNWRKKKSVSVLSVTYSYLVGQGRSSEHLYEEDKN